jgi:hypothetical protein
MMLSPLVQFVHKRHVSKEPIPDIQGNTTMLILSGSIRHQHMSETRIAVCPVLGPVFVLSYGLEHPEDGDVGRRLFFLHFGGATEPA